ncbi:NACHT domain-containing NTPase [Saccharopolyspora gloriosae]|uniref:NACHT domain-containing protein n=1 Tax=Saccharopolyspora gloriosae TaxID=455344 RepID=UPI001FB668E5|nr:NACHT domain-containing protein [Saccharopolyspora gloriosae]
MFLGAGLWDLVISGVRETLVEGAPMPQRDERNAIRHEVSGTVGGDVHSFGKVDGSVHFHQQSPDDPPLLRELALEVRERWEREARRRRILPELPMRWHQVPAQVPENESDRDDPRDIARFYRDISPRRLVVLGDAGVGKSVLCMRFVLTTLKRREPNGPVPVLYSLGSWNPSAISLHDWLIERLSKDYPLPAGTTDARKLVVDEKVLPVLDGLDEIPDELHAAALRHLGEYPRRFVLTSRTPAYQQALQAETALRDAEVVVLTELDRDDLAATLPDTTAFPGADPWEPILRRLRETPDEPGCAELTAVLRNPLMMSLARSVYRNQRKPDELLDTARFPTSAALQEHLLEEFLPTVYRNEPESWPAGQQRPWPEQRPQRWLGHLARHLRDSDGKELAWWRVGEMVSSRTRTLVIALLSGLVIFTSVTVVHGLVYLTHGFAPLRALGECLRDASFNGVIAGVTFGAAHWIAQLLGKGIPEPSRVRLLFRAAPGEQRLPRNTSWLVARAVLAVVVGAAFGFAARFAEGLLRAWQHQPDALLGGWVEGVLYAGMFSAGALVAVGALSVLEARVDVRATAEPIQLLRSNRRTTLGTVGVFALTFGIVVALVGTAVYSVSDGFLWGFRLDWGVVEGLRLAVLGSVGGGISVALGFTAWGQWIAFGRIWLPLVGRLPWRTAAFLEDARDRQVLRTHGALYQFRHERLLSHLAPPDRVSAAAP